MSALVLRLREINVRSGIARPVIPKRGEKDFEPNVTGGSNLQRHVLDRSRNAMFDALRAAPGISSKSVSHAVWYPDIARAHVTVARGVHFANMGHSVARTSTVRDGMKRAQKRLELLPEEALYLVERGAMFCWEASDAQYADIDAMEDSESVPMSVQQAFAEMVGREDLTLEKYQVFAYLRRLGYMVMRTKPPSSDYPTSLPVNTKVQVPTSILGILYYGVRSAISRLTHIFSRAFDWWRPLLFNRWLHHNMDYHSIFKSLRFLPSGFDAPLHVQQPPNTPPSPYEIFYNLYKPSTPFKKTAPPPPDFSVVVVNARTTPMPSLPELTALFDVLPELPPPVPRKRISYAQQKQERAAPALTSSAPPFTKSPLWHRIFSWGLKPPSTPTAPPRNPNPFLALKTGKKMVVVAAVDAGTISFFRFGQGAFNEWPMQ
ncbi:tRNA-splicing endonuclease subunit sen54 N-term-domain-containing protein [Sparassis latifolia]